MATCDGDGLGWSLLGFLQNKGVVMEDFKNMKIDEIARTHPETLVVFQEHGIDLCCGGRLTLTEVARKHRLDLERLVRELEKATPAAR